MAPKIIRSFPLAYHITLHTYGSWLPGDPRGWHHRGDGARAVERPGSSALHGISRELQRDPTVMLTAVMMVVVVESIVGLARVRNWRLSAAAAVPSHLHAVIGAPLLGLTVIAEIREASARLLDERGLHDPARRLWSEGGHFSVVQTVAQLMRATEYVVHHRVRAGG